MANEKNKNPLLEKFSTPFGSVPFDQIRNEHYMPAIVEGLRLARERVEKIKNDPATPTFENTLSALEDSSWELDQASGVYFNLFSAHADEKLQALAQEISPLLAAFSSDLSLDEKLFTRIKNLYDQRASLGLNEEQNRVLEKSYRGFVRNGALLKDSDKAKLRALDQESSLLWPRYSEHLLKATNEFELEIERPEDLKGLPDSALEAAAFEAEKRGKKGSYVFTLQAPSYIPLMSFAENETLREKMARAYGSRAFRDAFDNQELVKRIAVLRHDRALLLGYKNHAEYTLEERMAESSDKVNSFLSRIRQAAFPAAQRDLSELTALKHKSQPGIELKAWDVAFYSEKLKEEKFAFNEEDLRPYFQLEKVVQGVFKHATLLYGLSFTERKDIPIYHEDVKVFEVQDELGQHVGLFYADFFPRETKRNGAWMTSFREQGLAHGELLRPHIAIVCNFTKPTPTKPSLLSYDEVRTLFHEFGHALHGLLSNCTYRSISGTNVYWDFVELPSQIMENWAQEKEGLDLFAEHFETKEKIPAELVEKIKKSATFQSGLMALRQVTFATLDMAWHTADPNDIKDVEFFEEQVLAPLRILPKVTGSNSSCSFSHIFAGGYSAGYYSYKWAEVLDADAFELFKEKGIFNREVADSFRKNILSKGGTAHPMTLYTQFRGREPDPDALLRREELL